MATAFATKKTYKMPRTIISRKSLILVYSNSYGEINSNAIGNEMGATIIEGFSMTIWTTPRC